MTLNFAADGSVIADGTEQNLFATVVAAGLHGCYVHTNNMQSGDVLEIRVYVYDQNTSSIRQYSIITLNGDQVSDSYFVDFIPSRQYRVSIKQTDGVNRTYTWERVIVT